MIVMEYFRSTFLWGGAFFVAIGLAFFGLSVQAEEDILEELGGKLEDLEKKKESYSNIVDLKQKEAEVYDAQVRSLTVQATEVAQDIEENQGTLTDVRRDITSLIRDIEQKEIVIRVQKEVLSNIMRTYYDQRQMGVVGALVGKSSGDVLFASEDRSSQLQGRVGETLGEITALRESLEKDKIELERKRSDLENLQIRLEKQEDYLEGAQTQKQQLLEKALTEKGKYAWRLDKVEEEIREIQEELNALRINNIANLDISSLPKREKGLLEYPLKTIRLTQGYGDTDFDRWYDFHTGVDFGASIGTDVFAVEDGIVVDTNLSNYAYGNWVAIRHKFNGKEIVSFYGHLSKIDSDMKAGKKVDKGDIIGEVGNTGNSTGPHLHFGVYQGKGFYIKRSSVVNGVKLPPDGLDVNPYWYLP